MNKIKNKINVEELLSQINMEFGTLSKYNREQIRVILNSVNDIGVNKTSRKFNISKSTIKRWRVPNFNSIHLKKQYHKNAEKLKIKRKKLYPLKKDILISRNNEYQKKRYASDPGFRMKCLLRTRIWKVLKEQNATKMNKFDEYIGCTLDELKKYIELKFLPNMNWQNYGKWHIDHITPCASFDLSKIEEQKRCFHYTNLQPLWAEDNLSKSNKLPEN